MVPNPFFGVAEAGQFATRATIERGQLLRPYPQFGNVYMMQATGAHSQYRAAIIQLRKRTTGVWGGNFSYTYSRLNDNQSGESNYYSSVTGRAEQLHGGPGLAVLQPGLEYGRSLLDTPHKIVVSPIFSAAR